MTVIITFFIGLAIGATLGYIAGILEIKSIQISGDNSTQIQITNKEKNDASKE